MPKQEHWPLSKQDDIDRNYIRNHPETMPKI